jgi:acyl carrier protein
MGLTSKTDGLQSDTDEVFREIRTLLEAHNPNRIEISEETDLSADLNIDSVAAMDLLMNIEDKFEIDIPLNLVGELRSVRDLADVVRAQLKDG